MFNVLLGNLVRVFFLDRDRFDCGHALWLGLCLLAVEFFYSYNPQDLFRSLLLARRGLFDPDSPWCHLLFHIRCLTNAFQSLDLKNVLSPKLGITFLDISFTIV